MISSIISRLVILLFGTLYPAYASYKAVKSKNVKEYVKWMMYWIVFALFTCAETFTDVFFSWLPFYYEIKIILVIWLLSPATKGSSILYRKFVHPTLSSREQEIDEYINKAKEQSYKQFLDLGSKGVSALMQTAIKGGGGIVNQLRKSYSLSDLTDSNLDDGRDETDVVITDPRLLRRRRSPGRAAASSSLYFSEVDIIRSERIQHVQSAEDISSGYSSGEALYAGPSLKQPLVRAGSISRPRPTRVTRSTSGLKKSSLSEEIDDSEVFDANIIFLNGKAQAIDQLGNRESSEEEFVDSVDTLHGNQSVEDNISYSKVFTACSKPIEVDVKSGKRGGRYNKAAAPRPPAPIPTIKATLVLKPGIIKALDSKTDCKEIFVHTPKTKRRTLIDRSLSISKGKLDSSLSKIMSFPKKIKNSIEKRSSWHELDLKNTLSLGETKVQSKSDNNLSKCDGKQVTKSTSRLSIHTMAESPMAHRRLRIIRRYVDEDID